MSVDDVRDEIYRSVLASVLLGMDLVPASKPSRATLRFMVAEDLTRVLEVAARGARVTFSVLSEQPAQALARFLGLLDAHAARDAVEAIRTDGHKDMAFCTLRYMRRGSSHSDEVLERIAGHVADVLDVEMPDNPERIYVEAHMHLIRGSKGT